MANAQRDNNGVPTMQGTLQSDGQTPINIVVNPTNNGLKVLDGTTGSASTRPTAPRDGNTIPVLIGVSSADGKTPIPVASDSNGNLLIKST